MSETKPKQKLFGDGTQSLSQHATSEEAFPTDEIELAVLRAFNDMIAVAITTRNLQRLRYALNRLRDHTWQRPEYLVQAEIMLRNGTEALETIERHHSLEEERMLQSRTAAFKDIEDLRKRLDVVTRPVRKVRLR